MKKLWSKIVWGIIAIAVFTVIAVMSCFISKSIKHSHQEIKYTDTTKVKIDSAYVSAIYEDNFGWILVLIDEDL